MDATAIERKWSGEWRKARIFEPDPRPGTPKKYITAAFPYPNSPQHIGHARTYTTADIYARYLRLKGNHVLFPMAFHVTGTPILAMAKRIAARDKEVLSVFENIYGIPPKKAESLTDPKELVAYFSDEIERGMKEMGFSIDWRRRFYSYDARFNKFIEWQFRKLKELGYLVKGEYPIAWCPSDKQALGSHDTKGDVDPELKEYTVIKFRFRDGFLLAATLRPETIYGVTNIWINPDLDHVKARSRTRGEIYYVVKTASMKMDYQGFDLEILEEFKGSELLSKKESARNLVTGEDVPLYPATYVKDDSGTGIVMSVPSHAPYDHIGLLDMGIHLDYTPIVKVEGFTFMAKELIEKMGIKDQSDPRLEDIVKEVYKKEILTGTMVHGPYEGMKVSDAIERTKADLAKKGLAYSFWEISNKPVLCRCGAEGVVTLLKDQWFIDYGIPEWKEKAKECLASMSIIPEKSRAEYLYTIDWFKTRPCTRSAGLGTRFPFDESKMIEALADSTIYMAFYTIAHQLQSFEPEKLDDAFFDYVFLGKGEGEAELKPLRDSFLYWYPVDSRHSAGDLIRNHLGLYIFNHVAIMEKRHWPRQIATNGFVLMDGAKMSKSMGNILPLRKAISEYGADVIRFSVVSGADLSTDTDFNKSVAEGVRSRLAVIERLVESSSGAKGKPHGRIEKWLLSRLNRKIGRADKLFSELALRDLALELFYEVVSDLQWYMKRSKDPNLHDFFASWLVLMAPMIPHCAEEWWSRLSNEGLVSLAPFPQADQSKVDEALERGEEMVKQVHADIEKISGLIGKKPEKVTLIIADEWKRKLVRIAKEQKAFDGTMKAAGAAGLPMKDAANVMKQIMRNVHALPDPLGAQDEFDALMDAKGLLESDYSCKVEVLHEKDSRHQKARNAMPGKPAIVIE